MITQMIESLALRIAKAIKKIEPNQTASVEVMKFSLEFLFNTLITFIIISIVGWITGAIGQTFLGLFAFMVLRFFSGGLHFRKAIHCSLLTTIFITIAPHIALSRSGLFAIMGISFLLLLVFAPSNIEGHARIPKKYFPILKTISLLLVLSNLLFLNSTIAIVHLIQATTTISIRR